MVCDLTPVSQNNYTIRMLLQYHMQANYLGNQIVPCTCRRVPLQETFLHRILTGKGYEYENTSESCNNSDKNHHADSTQRHSPNDYPCEASRVELQTSFLQCHRRLQSQETGGAMDSSPSTSSSPSPSSSSSSSSPFRINPRRHFNRSEPLPVSASSASSPSSSPSSPQHLPSKECTPPHPEELDSSSSPHRSSSSLASH